MLHCITLFTLTTLNMQYSYMTMKCYMCASSKILNVQHKTGDVMCFYLLYKQNYIPTTNSK